MKSKRLSSKKREYINNFFEKYIHGFMLNDINKAKQKPSSANYLVAQGLMVITEFFGGLITGNVGIRGQSEENFMAGLQRMEFDFNNNSDYYYKFTLEIRERNINRELKAFETVNAYKLIRCGLLHEYFIKGNGSWVINNDTASIHIVGSDEDEDKPTPGFWYDSKERVIKFHVDAYSRDLIRAINNYKDTLLVEKDLELIEKFIKAIENLEKRRIKKSKGNIYWRE